MKSGMPSAEKARLENARTVRPNTKTATTTNGQVDDGFNLKP